MKYGKLSLDDIKQIIGLLPQISEICKEVLLKFSQNPLRREILNKDFYWSALYEHSLLEQVKITLECFGALEKIEDIALSGKNSTSNLLAYIQDDSNFNSSEIDIPQEQKKYILGSTYSLHKTIESIQIQGQSLNQLVQQVMRGNDNDKNKALFKIIEIDRSAMSCPCIANRIALAELEQDNDFFDSLKKALNGPTKKKFASYRELRFLLEILDEDGTLNSLTINQQYQLFCVDLGLYPYQGSDPAKSLHQFIRRWKNERST